MKPTRVGFFRVLRHVFNVVGILFTVGAADGRPEFSALGGQDLPRADLRAAGESTSFIKLRENVVTVIEQLPAKLVSDVERGTLLQAFSDIFRDFEKKKLDEIQPAAAEKRRIPYGTIHRLAHETIDNLPLKPVGLHEIHRAIHFAFTNSYSDDICYPQFSKNHTGCLERQGRTGCNSVGRGISASDKVLILAAHDDYRSEVARGAAVINDEVTLPEAAAMARMAWDEELEALAQAWADQCIYSTDCDQCRRTDRLRFVGQSLIRFKHVSSPLVRPDWRKAIDTWAVKSKAALPLSTADVLAILTSYRPDDAYSAYTQMIWDFTYLVGCGYSMYKDADFRGYSQLYVCNYGPAGNVVGTQVYDAGSACSRCPRSHVCDQATKMCTYGEAEEAPHGFVRASISKNPADATKANGERDSPIRPSPESAAAIVEI